MTVSRREVLGTLGVASASTLLWAVGCRAPVQSVRRAPQVSDQVRGWLRDAVARLVAVYPTVHALAVSRTRTAVAVDVLGAGAARLRCDGVVLTVRGPDGPTREHVLSELSQASLQRALDALGAPRQRTSLDFGAAPSTPAEPPRLDERDLRQRVELLRTDPGISSRIVYTAAMLDIDDALVWSVAPGRDLEQRLVRVRQSAVRAAWNGARPSVGAAEHAWSGGLDDGPLQPAELAAASQTALELMTPGAFGDGERTVVLDPSVAALLVDTAARRLLTSAAARRPDVAHRAPANARLASSLLTVVDDPTTAAAYGGFAFDDEGEPAAPVTLLDAGRVAARLTDRAGGGAGRGRRPGHLGPVEPSPSHLVVAPGAFDTRQLHTDGLILEGGLGATYDPASDRIRVTCARARELKAGNTTGRVHADVELTGSLTALLAAIDGIAREPSPVALGGDTARPASLLGAGLVHAASAVDLDSAIDLAGAIDRDRRWSSASVPALRTRGLVRFRGSRA